MFGQETKVSKQTKLEFGRQKPSEELGPSKTLVSTCVDAQMLPEKTHFGKLLLAAIASEALLAGVHCSVPSQRGDVIVTGAAGVADERRLAGVHHFMAEKTLMIGERCATQFADGFVPMRS